MRNSQFLLILAMLFLIDSHVTTGDTSVFCTFVAVALGFASGISRFIESDKPRN